tara:strand:- start:679 stop:1536 length:858 start_codon:yes stop_codon:yes gene_type:complete
MPDGITTTDFIQLKGSQGIQGAQGVTGLQGIQGEQGVTGPQGEKGDQGDAGVTGAQGDTGLQGTGIWQGLWQESKQYVEGDHVKWDNLPYVLICTPGSACIQGQPGMDNDWLLLITIGETGEQGETGQQGVKGETGQQGEEGRSSFQGTWQDTITYQEGDIVTYNEIPYQLICPEGISCRNDAPTSESSLWQTLKVKGEQGIQGESGTAGTAGVDADIMIILLSVGGATLLLILVYLFVALRWYYACCPPGGGYANVQRSSVGYSKEKVEIAYEVMLDKDITLRF